MEIIQVRGPYYFTDSTSGTKYSLIDMKNIFFTKDQPSYIRADAKCWGCDRMFKLHLGNVVHELYNGWTINNRSLGDHQIEEINMIEASGAFSVESIMHYAQIVTDPVLVKKSVCFGLPMHIRAGSGVGITGFATLQDLYYDNIMCITKSYANSSRLLGPRYKQAVRDNGCISRNDSIIFITGNKHYSIEKSKFHINGKYIAEYTLDEISELSPPYVISTNSSIEYVEDIQQWYINYTTNEIQIVDFRTDYPYTPVILKMLIDMKQIKTIVLFRYKSAKIYDEILDQGVEVVIRNK